MAISIETLALARKYADAVAAAGSKEALDKAIQQAIAESKLYTDDVFSHIVSFKVEIVDSLPETNIDQHVIYFLKKENPSEENDIYYEYMYINNFWELIGSTELDLSPYWTIEQTKTYIASKEYSLPRANKTSLGGVKIDGESIGIDNKGFIYVVDEYTTGKAEKTAQSVVDANFIDIKANEIENLFN